MAADMEYSRHDTALGPAVAGMFYPAVPENLRTTVDACLENSRSVALGDRPPRALIVPHAGLVYSGVVAASAYRLLVPWREQIERVVLLGPSHYVAFTGMALPAADALRTPLGTIDLDKEAMSLIDDLPWVLKTDEPHAREHCLEVQLPFLQSVLDEFRVLPLVIGEAGDEQVFEVLERLPIGAGNTVLIVSSDLSHFHGYEEARRIDEQTARQIETLDTKGLEGRHACGYRGVRGLMRYAARHKLNVRCLDRRSSGDTSGDRTRVVGYGAWVFG